MVTIRDALLGAQRRFRPISDSPGLDAHVLLGEVLRVERAYLLAYPEQPLTETQTHQFEAMVRRHADGEPVAYILGRRGFYDRDFIVTPDVLIPRPETELLLERALAFVANRPNAVVADIGTGSGALAVTLATHAPQATVYAVDISEAALGVARRNAEQYDIAERVAFLQGDLLEPLIRRGIRLDLIMANLPYIASDEVPRLAVSRYEPVLALDGGPDGLVLVRRLLDQLPDVLTNDGLALFEIGADQGPAALELVEGRGTVYQDYAGLDRILEIRHIDLRG